MRYMRWEGIKGFSKGKFQRLTGVKRVVFEEMVRVVSAQRAIKRKHLSRGRPCKLGVEDQLLMMLMYYREYRTFFHTGSTYGISEAQCWRVVTKMERLLIQSYVFALKGKKSLYQDQEGKSSIIIDVSEHGIERPKKSNATIIQVKEKSIR